MQTTQDHLNIQDITQNIVTLKDGGGALVIKTSAVNFGLLSELEQVSIIETFAQMLNSLSFSIQIVIHSQRLDISSYLTLLDMARSQQRNSLLSNLITNYRAFIQSTIKENEVLDKQFYIVIPVSPLEVGLGYSKKEDRIKKITTLLLPRRDQIIRQLGRIGLKGEQLTTNKLVQLFYGIYNQLDSAQLQLQQRPVIESVVLADPKQMQAPPTPNIPQQPQPTTPPNTWQTSETRVSKNHPFVVEELTDAM